MSNPVIRHSRTCRMFLYFTDSNHNVQRSLALSAAVYCVQARVPCIVYAVERVSMWRALSVRWQQYILPNKRDRHMYSVHIESYGEKKRALETEELSKYIKNMYVVCVYWMFNIPDRLIIAKKSIFVHAERVIAHNNCSCYTYRNALTDKRFWFCFSHSMQPCCAIRTLFTKFIAIIRALSVWDNTCIKHIPKKMWWGNEATNKYLGTYYNIYAYNRTRTKRR